MPAFRPNRIAAPEVLKRLSRVNLLRLLRPFHEHFKDLRLPPAERDQDEPSHYSFPHLAAALLDTAEPPPHELAKALFFIHHCATEEAEEHIETELRKKAEDENTAAGKAPDVDHDRYLPSGKATPEDLALHAWLIDHDILEGIYPILKTTDPKSAMTYPAKKPKIPAPKLDRLDALIANFDQWYHKKKRRCEGTTIKHRQDDDGSHHFVIKRPDSYARLGVMGKAEAEDFGFPERFDLVIIRRDPAEMVVVAKPKGVREKYRQDFADYLYNDSNLFEGVDKYTLAPLAEPLSVDFEPVRRPGYTLDEIKLVLTHHTFGPKQSVTRQDPDIIAGMSREKGRIPHLRSAPKRAKFSLIFDGDVDKKGVPRPVFLELDPPHTCRYSRHCDTEAVDAWLQREKFIVERAHE
jgi:hypothetical protein